MDCDLSGLLDAPERPPAAAGGDSLRRPHPFRVERAARQDAAAADGGGGGTAARPRRRHRPRRGAGHLPPAVPAAQPLRPRHRRAARRAQHLPRREGLPVGHALRHRGRGLRRRRQVDGGAPSPGPALPLARASPRGTRHDGRLPAPDQGAPGPRPDVAERFPRVLRPPGADALRGGHQGRQVRSHRARLLPPDLRHRPGREAHGAAAGHPDRGGPQRPSAGCCPARTDAPGSVSPTTSTSACTWMLVPRTSSSGT